MHVRARRAGKSKPVRAGKQLAGLWKLSQIQHFPGVTFAPGRGRGRDFPKATQGVEKAPEGTRRDPCPHGAPRAARVPRGTSAPSAASHLHHGCRGARRASCLASDPGCAQSARCLAPTPRPRGAPFGRRIGSQTIRARLPRRRARVPSVSRGSGARAQQPAPRRPECRGAAAGTGRYSAGCGTSLTPPDISQEPPSAQRPSGCLGAPRRRSSGARIRHCPLPHIATPLPRRWLLEPPLCCRFSPPSGSFLSAPPCPPWGRQAGLGQLQKGVFAKETERAGAGRGRAWGAWDPHPTHQRLLRHRVSLSGDAGFQAARAAPQPGTG